MSYPARRGFDGFSRILECLGGSGFPIFVLFSFHDYVLSLKITFNAAVCRSMAAAPTLFFLLLSFFGLFWYMMQILYQGREAQVPP